MAILGNTKQFAAALAKKQVQTCEDIKEELDALQSSIKHMQHTYAIKQKVAFVTFLNQVSGYIVFFSSSFVC